MSNQNSDKHLEIEVKFQIQDPGLLEQLILSIGGRVKHEEVFQRTVRFDTPEKELEKMGIFMRVRVGEKNVMTVKKKKSSADSNYFERNEWETEIGDPEILIDMLKTLGFSRLLIMEKYRKSYDLDGVTISIDRLPFGNFIETEGEKGKIEETIKALKLDQTSRVTVTYWDLHDAYNREHGLTEENIVF